MVIEVTEHGGWTEAACRCGVVRVVIAAAAAGLTAEDVRGGLVELVDHARGCPAASEADAELVERLTAERFRPSPLH